MREQMRGSTLAKDPEKLVLGAGAVIKPGLQLPGKTLTRQNIRKAGWGSRAGRHERLRPSQLIV
jgi:hypothetical protein